MLAHFAAWLVATLTSIILFGGYGGLVLLMALESACIPVPSELIMPFAGYLASAGKMNLWLAATAGAVGCNLGSALAYEVGAWGGLALLQRIARTRIISAHEIERSLGLFRRYGSATVFFCRLLPIVRTYIALPAGIARMGRLRFHAYTFLGSWIWCLALAYAGYYLGKNWETSPALHSVMHILDAVALLLIIGFIAWLIYQRRPGQPR